MMRQGLRYALLLILLLCSTTKTILSAPTTPKKGGTGPVPTFFPTKEPSANPTLAPTRSPTRPPTAGPTTPTQAPTAEPTFIAPTQSPTLAPSLEPTVEPTLTPTLAPSLTPTQHPSRPTRSPSAAPTIKTSSPSLAPSLAALGPYPTPIPTPAPTAFVFPTSQPSRQPSGQPTRQPTMQPSRQPSRQPSSQPSGQPTSHPIRPTGQPTRQPSGQPSRQPSRQPSSQPSRQPSGQPSGQPTNHPIRPTGQPTRQPSGQPSRQPTSRPTRQPSSQPSRQPSGQPSSQPSRQPSRQPIGLPTSQPSVQPSSRPSRQPSSQPSRQPSRQPSGQPSRHPSRQPTSRPSRQPSGQPTSKPSRQPSTQPSSQPSRQPTVQPSRQPTGQPSAQPSGQPSRQPSRQPSAQPSRQPTRQPSGQPTSRPSRQPTSQPTRQPSGQPSSQPSRQPTSQPTRQPTRQPSSQPSRQPSGQPSRRPTGQPTGQPSLSPSRLKTSAKPTNVPIIKPTAVPTPGPTALPTTSPTTKPTPLPTTAPTPAPTQTSAPSFAPTKAPTYSPSYAVVQTLAIGAVQTISGCTIDTYNKSTTLYNDVLTMTIVQVMNLGGVGLFVITNSSVQGIVVTAGSSRRRLVQGSSSSDVDGSYGDDGDDATQADELSPLSLASSQLRGQRQEDRYLASTSLLLSYSLYVQQLDGSITYTSLSTILANAVSSGLFTTYMNLYATQLGATGLQAPAATSSVATSDHGYATSAPSTKPTFSPTARPTNPTGQPSGQPSRQPTRQPTSQPSRQPSRQPTSRPSAAPSHKPPTTPLPSPMPTLRPTAPTFAPTIQLSANHSQRFEALDQHTFDVYTALWLSSHSTWANVAHQPLACTNEQQVQFPACVGGAKIDSNGGKSNMDCPTVQCFPAPAVEGFGCLPTPSDTMDYIPPVSPVSPVNDGQICQPFSVDQAALAPFFGMDAGVPPFYLPLSAMRLNFTGTISSSSPDGNTCEPVQGAVIDAWQINPRSLVNFTALTMRQSNLQGAINEPTTSVLFPHQLRDISCRGRTQSDASGVYSFETIMPPSYGPPRHIMLQVSAPGYETLITRIYFAADWRLQQLTTLDGEVQSRDLDSAHLVHGFYTDTLETKATNARGYNYTYGYATRASPNEPVGLMGTPTDSQSKFPGVIARDPRVVDVLFKRTYQKYSQWHGGSYVGHFESYFNVVLRPLRPTPANNQQATGDFTPPQDLNGLWADLSTGQQVMVETIGNTFYAQEFPHKRTWGTVMGSLVGDTIRGIDFRRSQLISSLSPPTTLPGGQAPPDNIFSSSSSCTGVVLISDSFVTAPAASSSSLSTELTIEWTGGGLVGHSKWSKVPTGQQALGYRYLKLLITRETGGYKGGKMVINEIKFYDGVLAQREMPSADNKMSSPRQQNTQDAVTQRVTCSTFQDQDTHCFKAFDGDSSSNSAWITSPVGSTGGQTIYESLAYPSGQSLAQPQWVLFDFGLGRGIKPSAIKIVCDAGNPSMPLGCPRTFSLLGSYDNIRFESIYNTDMYDYKNNYAAASTSTSSSSSSSSSSSTPGILFPFFWEAPTGRPNGHQCGSCDSGPSFVCHIDKHDDSCSSKYCNKLGLCDSLPLCRAGEYMELGIVEGGLGGAAAAGSAGGGWEDRPAMECRLCASGRYGSSAGLTSSACSGLCQEGYFCPAGSTSPTEKQCGGLSVYCPLGSGQPVLVPAGYYSTHVLEGGSGSNNNGTTISTSSLLTSTSLGYAKIMSAVALCEKGYWCSRGVKSMCPVGRYGDQEGLQTNTCVGECIAGEYCSPGSISPTLCPPGYFCPDGLIREVCPAGTFGGISGLTDRRCSGLCARGHYCPQGSTKSKQFACPPGRYGAISGIGDSACSGLCEAGYYCPPPSNDAGIYYNSTGGTAGEAFGNTNPTSFACGSVAQYCPLGSPLPITADFGYYTWGGAEETRQGQRPCEMGFYCLNGVKTSCPQGTYGDIVGLSSLPLTPPPTPINTSFVNATLAALYPTHRPTARPTPKPTFVIAQPSPKPTPVATAKPTVSPTPKPTLSPTASPTLTKKPSPSPTKVPTGQPSGQPSSSPTQANHTGPSFMPSAKPSLPPSRLFDVFVDSFYCSGFCVPGFYCPFNSTSSMQVPCPPGRYGATSGLGDATCTGPCPMGNYCPAGTATPIPCPAGRYGNTTGLVSSACGGGGSGGCWEGGCPPAMCLEGHYCPLGSMSSRQVECGDDSVYCPTGSSIPSIVDPGYYSVGPFPSQHSHRRTAQVICEPGYFCVGGVKAECPPGTWGETQGLSTPSCTGACRAGWYCPSGSSNETSLRCPAGRYGATSGLFNSACTGKCTAGYHCPEGSTSPTEIECGVVTPANRTDLAFTKASDTGLIGLASPYANVVVKPTGKQNGTFVQLQEPNSVFCLAGSAAPLVVLPGYYSTGNNRTTRTSQSPCPMGAYCMQGVLYDCPAGRYGRAQRLSNSSCSGPCAAGSYCPAASTSRNQYPCPAGRFGAIEGLSNNLCSGACQKPLDCPIGSIRSTPLSSVIDPNVY